MKAIYIRQFGDSKTLEIGEVPTPEPGPDEMQIRIDHTSVNPVDWKIREGYLQSMMPHEFPLILGWDAAGTVSQVGANVTSFAVGDEVYSYARQPTVQFGTYAEYTVINASAAAAKPTTLSFAEAATVPLVALTAWQALVGFAKVASGENVFITAGAGGVGSFGIQFAKHRGANVITTASAKNHDYVRSLGADHVVDYTKADTAAAVRSWNDNIDVVFDCAGGDSLAEGFEVIRNGGRLVSIVDTPSEERAKAKDLRADFVFVQPSGEELTQIGALIDAGKVQVPHLQVKSVQEAAAALDENQNRHVRGKVALKIDFSPSPSG